MVVGPGVLTNHLLKQQRAQDFIFWWGEGELEEDYSVIVHDFVNCDGQFHTLRFLLSLCIFVLVPPD